VDIVIWLPLCEPEVSSNILSETPPGRGGEIQLTAAIKVMANRGEMRGVLFKRRRLRTGQAGLTAHHGDLRRPRAARKRKGVHPLGCASS